MPRCLYLKANQQKNFEAEKNILKNKNHTMHLVDKEKNEGEKKLCKLDQNARQRQHHY